MLGNLGAGKTKKESFEEYLPVWKDKVKHQTGH